MIPTHAAIDSIQFTALFCGVLTLELASLGGGSAAIAASTPDAWLTADPLSKGDEKIRVSPAAWDYGLGARWQTASAADHQAEVDSAMSAPSLDASDLRISSVSEVTQSPAQPWWMAQVSDPRALNPTIAQAEAAAASASSDQADLAKASQNPIASLISVPFQNNTNFGVGDFDRTSNILNVQPVIPTPLSDHLTLVNRTIIPIAYQPELSAGVNSAFGLGDINYTGFFVPATTGNFTWGVGPSLVLPTATDTVLGTGKWSMGPAAVALVTQDRIVTGGLISQIWSFAGDSRRADVSLFTFQPFFNYNFDGGWFATTSPVINANWAAEGEQWTIPIGGGFGRVFAIGSQPVNAQVQAYYNVVKPAGGADWTLRAQLTLLFP
ncbi:MAG: hypothetical protein VKI82_10140 [Leptolyngbya sp.]|nr:hypothetical protein [Leptolyngbya sp.]